MHKKILPLLLTAIVLTGCSQSSRSNVVSNEVAMKSASANFNSGMDVSDAAEKSVYEYEPNTAENINQKDTSEELKQGDKLIYRGNISIETLDFSSTLSDVKKKVSDLGGFIESESDNDNAYGWYNSDYQKSATKSCQLRVRIPSDKFYDFADGLEGKNAKIIQRSVNVENVSKQYSDLSTTIESYEIQEQRLLDMMKDTNTVSEMLEIEARLTEVQNNLRMYQNILSNLDTDISYSTLDLYVQEVGMYSPPEATSYIEKMADAIHDAWDSFTTNISNLFLWFLRNVIHLGVFAGVVALFVCWVRRHPRKQKKTKIQRKDATEVRKTIEGREQI